MVAGPSTLVDVGHSLFWHLADWRGFLDDRLAEGPPGVVIVDV
jgi:hypothetical protein